MELGQQQRGKIPGRFAKLRRISLWRGRHAGWFPAKRPASHSPYILGKTPRRLITSA